MTAIPAKPARIPKSFMVSRDRVPRWNSEYFSVNAPWTYFFSPAAPDRSVVSSNPTTLEAMISVLISFTTPAAIDAALARAGVDEPGGHLCARDVGQQQQAPLHGQVLEHQEVDRQGAQPRPDRDRRVRTPGGRGAT